MDKRLLDSLNNLSLALEEIADTLKDKKEPNSATAKAMKGGDFIKEIKEINVGVKKLLKDTKKILHNQQTIIGLAKKSSGGTKDVTEELGKDKKKQSAFKEGIGVIMLIAVAVLAIGVAFKLIGDVNFLSVIALSIALPLLAIGFAKVHETLKKVGFDAKRDSKNFIIAVTSIAIAITLSSLILAVMVPLSFGRLVTAILIAAMFTAVSYGFHKIIKVFDKMSDKDLRTASIFLPLLLPAMALSIAVSSWFLKLIIPISFAQAMTAILIGIMFSAVSFGFNQIIRSFKNAKVDELAMAAMFLPALLPAMALSIAVSSWFLKLIIPISFAQALTAILIAGVFTIISLTFRFLLNAFHGLNMKEAMERSAIMPILLIALSFAIMVSSWLLSAIKPISFGQFLTALGISAIFVVLSLSITFISKEIGKLTKKDLQNMIPFFVIASTAIMISSYILSKTKVIPIAKIIAIGIFAVAMSIAVIAVAGVMWVLRKINLSPKDAIVGGLLIVLVSAAIMISSHILALGNYTKFPSVKWAAGVGLSLLAFIPAMLALGLIAMTGIGAIAIGLGVPMVLIVAGTIMETSKILAQGKYDNKGMVSWAASTALLFITFVPILLVLGVVGLASSVLGFFGADPWKKGNEMILDIASTIVAASYILSLGKYNKGPTKAWAEGVSLAIGAFAPVYMMLVQSSIFSALGDGGVGPKEFSDAILTVSQGIIIAAIFFAKYNAAFKNGPPESWAKGVGTAIGAFAPVLAVISGSGDWYEKAQAVEMMKTAILIISEGIITAAWYFSINKAPFQSGNYPSKRWGEGVGAALMAFAPVFEALSGKSWWQGSSDVISGMVNGIMMTSAAIVSSAMYFNMIPEDSWKRYPTKQWGLGVEAAIKTFIGIYERLEDNDVSPRQLGLISRYAQKISEVAYILDQGGKYFNTKLDPNYVASIKKNFLDYADLTESLNSKKSIGDKIAGGIIGGITSLLGIDDPTDPVQRIAKGMVVMANGYDILAKSVDKFASVINKLDPVKMTSFTRLTGNIALLSALDSKMFDNMLRVLERRGGVFADMLKIQSSEISGVNLNPSEGGDKKDKKDTKKVTSKGKTDSEKLDMVVELLGKITLSSQETSENTYKIKKKLPKSTT